MISNGFGRSILVVGGVLASGLLCWIALAVTEAVVGIRDPEFRYENQIGMWIPDARVGFINEPNFDAFAWGSVEVRTDEHGFRVGIGNRSPGRGPLVVGIGDSVMWGTGVSAGESLLGQLEAQLREDAPVEVINAGVVGYSSVQELRFLEQFIVSLEPDVVLLNFCHNDLMASEDPFDNVREIHATYLEEVLAHRGDALETDARSGVQQMISRLRSTAPVWPQINAMRPTERDAMMRLLVDRPIIQMVSLVRASGGRLVLLIIPPRAVDKEYSRSARRLSRGVRAEGGEVIDLTPHFAFEPPLQLTKEPGWIPRVAAIARILRWRGIRATHHQRDFVDSVHPSRRGNGVIATRVASHLRAAHWWRP